MAVQYIYIYKAKGNMSRHTEKCICMTQYVYYLFDFFLYLTRVLCVVRAKQAVTRRRRWELVFHLTRISHSNNTDSPQLILDDKPS